MEIKVILGSIRPQRAGKAIADWFMKMAGQYQGNLNISLIDLADMNLPFMDEPVPPMMAEHPTHEHTKRWSGIIDKADGFVFITPEYNHGYSPALKNAIDFLYKEWKDKPVAFVGYGGSGAKDSIRQLREVVEFIGMKPLEQQVGVLKIWEAFAENGDVKDENLDGDPQFLLSELESWFSR